jgi:hypothetical protein
MGGLNRARRLSAEQRREIALKAARARWRKKNGGGDDGGPAGGSGVSSDKKSIPGIT